MDTSEVRGMGQTVVQAEAGLKLFKEKAAVDVDLEAATKFKTELEAAMTALEEESKALTGKENKKLRQEKDKEKAALKNQKDYIDACKVVKGLVPVHGFFVIGGGEEPKADDPAVVVSPAAPQKSEEKTKKEKPRKEIESAGISKEERAELDGLKQRIIDKKTSLKAEGLSGGQINKNEEVANMVKRMNELKEKESPGSTAGKKDEEKGKKKGKMLDSETQAHLEKKKQEFEEYTERLRSEFKYSKKEIAADPEYRELKAEIAKLDK